MTGLHLVVPAGLDDLTRPSGGNAYDRRVRDALAGAGWAVTAYEAAGAWPEPDPGARAALAATVAGIPDGALVLVDGLIASCVPEVLVPAAARLRLVVLMHMPLGEPADDAPAVRPAGGDGVVAVRSAGGDGVVAVRSAGGADVLAVHSADDDGVLAVRSVGGLDPVARRERDVLAAAAAVVTTSAWTRRRLLDHYRLEPARVYVAEPGVDPARLAPGTEGGGELLCVAAVTPNKGHDVLLAALAKVAAGPWRLTCAGATDRDPAFVERLRRQAAEDGIGDRVRFTGPLAGDDLDRAYAGADLLVLASHAETYGMVVTEALARGLPVLVTAVGGLPEAVGRGSRRAVPGLLVPPDDAGALAGALADWLGDAELRARLRRTARQRRATLRPWSHPTALIASVLRGVAR